MNNGQLERCERASLTNFIKLWHRRALG